MGTFHDDKHALHGMTLAVRAADRVYVGRCDDLDADKMILVDVDVHAEGEDGRSNDEWLARAAAFGVTPRHRNLTLAMSDVEDFGPLSDFYGGVGKMRRAETTATPAPAPAPVPEPRADDVIVLTDGARAEVRRILTEDDGAGKGLRLAVAGGGCSGLVYKVELDERREGDVVQPCDDFEVLLDRKSTIYLRGVVLDYRGGLDGRGFEFRNPNATNTCGCGESFSI